jgi:predicted transcriptional regulator
MSLADDQDYVTKIVEKTERFVVAEMAKIKNDVTLIKNTQSESKAKIANLQSENQQLKAENETLKNQVHTLSREVENIRKHSGEQLLKTLEDSFRAGLMTVLRASKDVDMDITPVLQAMDLPMAASTPQTSDVPSQEFQSPVFPNRLSLYSRKRKSKTSAAPV